MLWQRLASWRFWALVVAAVRSHGGSLIIRGGAGMEP